MRERARCCWQWRPGRAACVMRTHERAHWPHRLALARAAFCKHCAFAAHTCAESVRGLCDVGSGVCPCMELSALLMILRHMPDATQHGMASQFKVAAHTETCTQARDLSHGTAPELTMP